MSAVRHPERPLREWPLEQLAEHASLHPRQATVIAVLLDEVKNRRGARAKALEARLAELLAACAKAHHAPPDGEVRRLRRTLAAAAEEIASLRGRVMALEVSSGLDEATLEALDAHRRVHLTPDAPAWLVAEVRRAYRRRFHPDREADRGRSARSEEVFKRAEACFAVIERHRGA